MLQLVNLYKIVIFCIQCSFPWPYTLCITFHIFFYLYISISTDLQITILVDATLPTYITSMQLKYLSDYHAGRCNIIYCKHNFYLKYLSSRLINFTTTGRTLFYLLISGEEYRSDSKIGGS